MYYFTGITQNQLAIKRAHLSKSFLRPHQLKMARERDPPISTTHPNIPLAHHTTDLKRSMSRLLNLGVNILKHITVKSSCYHLHFRDRNNLGNNVAVIVNSNVSPIDGGDCISRFAPLVVLTAAGDATCVDPSSDLGA